MREDILFATIAAGGGHVATAKAMSDALGLTWPGRYRTRVSDYMLELGLEAQDRRHKQLWRWLLRHPQLIRSGQRFMDAVPAAIRRWHELTLDRFARLAASDLNRAGTPTVVANHGWLAVGLTRAQLKYGLKSRVLVFATEPLDASALWAEPRVEQVLAPSREAANSLARLGLPEDRIAVTGYPVASRFLTPAPTPESGPFTVTLSLGGEGMGRDHLPDVRALLDEGIQVQVLTGRNRELLARLQELGTSGGLLKAFGHTDMVPELLAASHVVAGKAGPASVLESLALGRPFLVTSAAGLNELALARWLEQGGLGYRLRSSGLPGSVQRLRREPDLLEAMRAACLRLDFRDMARRTALAVAGWHETGQVPAEALGSGLTLAPAGYTS